MRKISLFILIFVITILYLLAINYLPSIFLYSETYEISGNSENTNNDFTVRVGVSDAVSVSIVRNRFYGRIYESNGDSILYLFKIIRIPIVENGIIFSLFHVIFFIVIIVLFVGIVLGEDIGYSLKGGEKVEDEIDLQINDNTTN